MKIRPIRGNLLVEPPTPREKTQGGIIIPESIDPNLKGITSGRIIAMADDVSDKYGFKIGMKVIFGKFTYTEVKIPPVDSGQPERMLLLINQEKVDGCVEE